MIHIELDRDRGLATVCLPVKFFTDDMPFLDEASLRTYLYICALVASGAREIEEKDLGENLRLSPEQLANIFKLLEMRGLIRWQASGFSLCDLESMYRNPRREDKVEYLEPLGERPREEELNNLIQQINATFYQGVMKINFYHSIEAWFYDYHFEPEVIYALFNELRRYNKLAVHGYAQQIAKNWYDHGIRTFSDLNNFVEGKSKINRIAQILQGKLRQQHTFSTYQMEFLQRWYQEWQMPFELIDEAFRRASLKPSRNSFPYIEGILNNWHEAGLQSLAEVEEYEGKYRAQYERQRVGQFAQNKQRSARANFQQREYEDADIEKLYRGLDFLQEESEEAES